MDTKDASQRTLDPRLYTPPLGNPSIGAGHRDAEEDKAESKRRKKERKLLKEAARPLDPWQRYKALSDTLDAEQDLVDLADHKARFALIILGALNAAIIIGATKAPANTISTSGFGAIVTA